MLANLPDDVGRLQGVELEAFVGDGAYGGLVVQVDFEETDDATFDVGAPYRLRDVERDLTDGAHHPPE